MKCLRKYQWVKLPRDIPDMGKGLMAYWAMLAFRAAFRKGNASYCGHSNPVAPGMWAGGVVGLKSILGVRSRTKALQILGELSSLGFLKYSLDSQTKKLTYEITDWVVKCSGAECMSGTVYASTGYGFLCLPRNITQRLANAKRVFDEADAWLDLWCHTTYEDYGNAFSFLAPVVQYGRFGSVLTLETLGERWGWEKTKVWRFFKKHGDVFSLYRLTYPGAADGIGAADTPAPESTLLTGVAASPVGGGDQPPIGYGNGAPSVDTVYGNAPEAQHFGAAYAGGFGESPQNGAQFADHGENVGQGFYSEAPLVAATFPSAPEGTSLRTVGDGVIEASSPDGGNTLWYNSAYYQEPDAPHSVMQSSNGVDWYAMQQQGNIPQFEVGEAAAAYNQAAFQNFMPGYDLPVSQVDGTHRQDGYFEVRHEDGSGTKFYDIARYAAPRGDYQVFEDSRGSQWYAIQGDAAVDRKPVYENGKPVYDNGKLRTTNVETIRYKQTPTRFAEPEKRGDIERKPPKRKM